MTGDSTLPATCPDCGEQLKTRGDVLVHALWALGQDDHRASFGSEA